MGKGFLLAGALGLAFFVGVYFGFENRPEVAKVTDLWAAEAPLGTDVNFAPFWKVWNILNTRYAATGTTTPVTTQDKVYGAIQGLVDSLGDPYTVFFKPDEKEIFESDIRGNFSGVGMEIGIRDDTVTVIAPLPGSPAKAAGIRPGDAVLEINDRTTTGMAADEAVKLIRGPVGSTVRLLIRHQDETEARRLSITRATIVVPTLTTDTRKGVFIIHLYNFSAPSADAFRRALRDFVDSKSRKLVLDLRGNPGGYLEAAVDMASWFLPPGTVVVQEARNETETGRLYRSKGYDIFNDNLKMVVLVDEGTASAAEILAGALSEHGVATLVGQKTFGKGSVQELVSVTPDTALKVTVAKWLTPKGHSISQAGLIPDIVVSITEQDSAADRDSQLEKAIEILNKK